MASVTIQGLTAARSFEVPYKNSPGGMARRRAQIDSLVKLSEAKGLEAFELAIDYTAKLLGVTAPEDVQWLRDNLPEETSDINRQAIEAAGGKVAEPAPGEVSGQ